MKVMRKGKRKEWSKLVECPNSLCSAVLLIAKEDIYTNNEGSGYICTCPECEERIRLPGCDIPAIVQKFVHQADAQNRD